MQREQAVHDVGGHGRETLKLEGLATDDDDPSSSSSS